MRSALPRLAAAALLLSGAVGLSQAQTLPGFDFTRAEDRAGWQPTHDVSGLKAVPEGLAITISGADPYIIGPPRDFPTGQLLWMRVRLWSETGGTGQVFYFRQGAAEEDSVRFPVRAGVWEEKRLPLKALGPGFRFRIDPPGTWGTCIVASLTFEPRVLLKEPEWPKPLPPQLGEDALLLRSGDLLLRHARRELGGFVLHVAERPMAVGHTRPLVGYLQEGQARWLPLSERAKVRVTKQRNALIVRAVARDADGADWTLQQRFAPVKAGPVSNSPLTPAIEVETRVTVNRDRSVIFLPVLVVFPGVASFGTTKGQGLFAGLEYLEDEPSSSEADLIGPASRRQVPDSLKITFPLMAIQAGGRYVGLIWEKDPAFSEPGSALDGANPGTVQTAPTRRFATLFDSPDRLFHSGGHVMGLLFPGSDGENRVEGNLLPYDGALLAAGKPLLLRATLIGGRGDSVVPAIRHYVALKGLPPVPEIGMDRQGYVAQAAAGWLDSKVREGDLFRHAYWPGTNWALQPAPDAAVFMAWLARQTTDTVLSRRLSEASARAIARAEPAAWNRAGVSHIRYPVASLVFGEVAANVTHARQVGRHLLERFEPDGRILYRPAPDRPDLGRTHFAPDANGLTAPVVADLLTLATVCGDAELIREGLSRLRGLNRYRNGVPRGAQTWEIPLHTPDILASAHLVRAYTLGYELTGEASFLEEARYWAWTGVPFVYLVPPTPHPVGLYATIAVLGATHWKAPVWIGLPVQWCGLVYADALYRLERHDPGGPWKRLADGITASGIQQSWPRGEADLEGLLPDSFDLRGQVRNPVAINPGTVQAPAISLLGGPALYDFGAFRGIGLFVHAPGALTDAKEEQERLTLTVRGWPERPYHVLVAGLKAPPRLRIDGKETPLEPPHQYRQEEGILILRLTGAPKIELSLPRAQSS